MSSIRISSQRFVEIFCAIVEAGNYTLAAQQLGLTPAAVSKAVARREAAVGVPLLRRTTRSMRLTAAGRSYYEECRKALTLLEAAERGLSSYQREPAGRVRLSVPTTYGHYRVLPLVGEFSDLHPRISLEVDVSNANVDLVADGFDLAVRMGKIQDSGVVARKLEQARVGVFASPTYLDRHGFPRHPLELDKHRCIGFVRPSTGRPIRWGFVDAGGTEIDLEPSRLLRCSGDFLACVTLARRGVGLVQSYHFVVAEDVREGRLVEVLRPFAGRSAPFSLLQPPGRASLAARLFADFLISKTC